jgi:nitrogen fixation NifU-like protein
MDESIYQEFIIDLYKNPLNSGTIPNPTYHAELANMTCGDMIEIFILVKSGRVEDVKFLGKGCAISQASASLFTEHIKGQTLSKIRKMTKNDILSLLKIDLTKNPSRMKCALLVFVATKKAISTDTTTI